MLRVILVQSELQVTQVKMDLLVLKVQRENEDHLVMTEYRENKELPEKEV